MYLRRDAKKQVSPYASPAWQTDYRNLPPCYTFVGDGEPFFCETAEYVQKLKNAGVEAEVDVYHTDVHAFDIFSEKNYSVEAKMKFYQWFEKALDGCLIGRRT